MTILLVLWASSYGFLSVPTMQEFTTEAQCRAALKYITEAHGAYRDAECIAVDPSGDIKKL